MALGFFAVLHVLLSAALVALILMHSGRDAGLGGMGFTPTSQGGTHIVERNLTRVTHGRGGAVLHEHGRALPPARVASPWLLARLHHVTCVCSDAQQTTDFYRDELGFTLVKKTVNFDDPHSYHLYFGDETGSPGSLITFFEWPRAERGRLGRGTLESIGLVRRRWSSRVEVEDPDGPAPSARIPATRRGLHDVVAIGNPDLYAGLVDEDAPLTFAEPVEETALIGAGITHHIAWRAADDAEQLAWRERLSEIGLRPTAQQDRKYFRSIYFRMPDGILLEIATDGPGFLVDETPTRRSARSSRCPPWLEPERETLERELVPIV